MKESIELGYGFENIRMSSYEELIEYVSEEDIMTHYFGEWEPNRHYHCPFKKERIPSFYISYYNQSLKWRRFGMFDSPKNPVEFVMFKFGIDFYSALNKIYQEIYLEGIKPMPDDIIKEYRLNSPDEMSMSIIIKDWEDYDLDYWLAYDGFSTDRLEKFKINAASEYWSNQIRTHISCPEDPLYCFDHYRETGKPSFTAYRPLADSEENIRKRKKIKMLH